MDGGVIIEEGPKIFTHPKEERTKQFLKRVIQRIILIISKMVGEY